MAAGRELVVCGIVLKRRIGMEERNTIRFKLMAGISALVFLVVLFLYWILASYFPEWKKVQRDHQEQLAMHHADVLTAGSSPLISQIVIPAFGKTDRCVTCHLSMEDSLMAGAPLPHRTHPGRFLQQHDLRKFGCTLCHGGQGQAITKEDAFGLNRRNAWHQPLLDQPFIQSSCGRCHLALYSANKHLEEVEALYLGQRIFIREGCMGCHKARGMGGALGPDLTDQGNKTIHEYNFRNVEGEQSVSNWLKAHFQDPEMVSPGSQMLAVALPEEDLNALVTFTMGLFRPDIPFSYVALPVIREFKGERPWLGGGMIYSMACSACHGKQGEGKDYETYDDGVPALFNRDFLSVASADMIRFTVLNGRGQKLMASWKPDYSGIYETDSLVSFIGGQKVVNAGRETVMPLTGDPAEGSRLFSRNCAMCHGEGGKGDTGPALTISGFLEFASKEYIFNTLYLGRPNTAMPSWSWFSATEMADIIAYISGGTRLPDHPPDLKLEAGDTEKGRDSFHYLCSRCHGQFGEGSTGPSILNPSFLLAADNHFLFRTISGGRAHTPMHGWQDAVILQKSLSSADISDIIAFMRSDPGKDAGYVRAGPTTGQAEPGREIFETHCAECHGKSGEGVKAPALNNQEFLNAASNGYILATVSIGREGTRMPSWGRGDEKHPELTTRQRNDLVAFIRSWQRVLIKIEN